MSNVIVSLNFNINEKVNIGNYESTGCDTGIEIQIPLTDRFSEDLSKVLDIVDNAIESNRDKIINIILKSKDEILGKTIKLTQERITEYGSIKQYYILNEK